MTMGKKKGNKDAGTSKNQEKKDTAATTDSQESNQPSQNGDEDIILCSPYDEPDFYWDFDEDKGNYEKKPNRRPASYHVSKVDKSSPTARTKVIHLPEVDKIRSAVKEWRNNNYDDYKEVTSITRKLLMHWNDITVRDNRFFFCELEAIETLIWLTESTKGIAVSKKITGDGSNFQRICSKMASGTGKTVIMAMLIAYYSLNHFSYPSDTRFTSNFLVIAPSIPVKNRLSVLRPDTKGSQKSEENYFDKFQIVPQEYRDDLEEINIVIVNWHRLKWEDQSAYKARKSVDKRGVLTDDAYARKVLGEFAENKNFVVINDEAHHAWRPPAGEPKKDEKNEDLEEEIEEAKIWMKGLERIHNFSTIIKCHDFSATPYIPSRPPEDNLFTWIVSDFNLSDAIESGLVKTPRIVDLGKDVKDNPAIDLYYIYRDENIRADLNKRGNAKSPLPDDIKKVYRLIASNWKETSNTWKSKSQDRSPVMISVVNRVETAIRVESMFKQEFKTDFPDLSDENHVIRIDSSILKEFEKIEERNEKVEGDSESRENGSGEAEPGDEEEQDDNGTEEKSIKDMSKKKQIEYLYDQVNTIGKKGKAGENVTNIVSVQMLNEGWDVSTVTHIIGLRAFSSQLLCEQVIGRGLRRISFEIDKKTNKVTPEYVNVFGVPFSFFPIKMFKTSTSVIFPQNTVEIFPDPDQKKYEITWPNIIRIDSESKPIMAIEFESIQPLTLLKENFPDQVTMIAAIGKSSGASTTITVAPTKVRLQSSIFRMALRILQNLKHVKNCSKRVLFSQVVQILEKFIESDRLLTTDKMNNPVSPDQRKQMIMASQERISNHLLSHISLNSTDQLIPIYDRLEPHRSTGSMAKWPTKREFITGKKTHINFMPYDAGWEAAVATTMDKEVDAIDAWVKNDHLGFKIEYVYNGEVSKYIPDFIVRLNTGSHVILEIKGEDNTINESKRAYLDKWVRAINYENKNGRWHWAVIYDDKDIKKKLDEIVATDARGEIYKDSISRKK